MTPNFQRNARGLLVLLLGTVQWAAQALAQVPAWPSKAIRLVVPYAAGGPADVIARLVAKKAGEGLQQTIVIDNKGGAGATIGVDVTLKAAPDGYTFALTGQGPLAGMPHLSKLPYVLADVQYLTLVARGPSVIAVSSKVAANNLADFIKLAKASPGKFNYGTSGSGTSPHIGAELLKMEADIELTHVPYKGAAPAMTALLGGEVDMVLVDLLNVLPHVAAGKLKVLAVAGPNRAPQLPDVPTTKEAGYPAVVMDTLYGVIAPLGVPPEVQQKIREALTAAVQSAEVKEALFKQGVIALTSTAPNYKALIQAEFDKWQVVVAKGKIKLD